VLQRKLSASTARNASMTEELREATATITAQKQRLSDNDKELARLRGSVASLQDDAVRFGYRKHAHGYRLYFM
jgi:hypothetical protein